MSRRFLHLIQPGFGSTYINQDTFYRLQDLGLERGWGGTAEQVKETINSLSEVLQAPDPQNVEKFFSRIPAIFSVVIFSPHGYFGQSDVLGLPDTGGQVLIILVLFDIEVTS